MKHLQEFKLNENNSIGGRQMKTSVLIEILEESLRTNGDLIVMSSCDYGDISHTEQLITIYKTDTCHPIESSYSESGYAFDEDNDNDNDIEEVLVLRGI